MEYNVFYVHDLVGDLIFTEGVPLYNGNLVTGIIRWNTVLRTYKEGINHGIMVRDFDF